MDGLIITRKTGESVYIADTKMTVVTIKGDKVKLQFVGPEIVKREEIMDGKLQTEA